MHERALMQDLVAEIERLGRSQRAAPDHPHRRPPRRALTLHAGSLPRALRRRLARHARRGCGRSPTRRRRARAPRDGVVLESVEVEA